jgi:hypothetical protein
MDQQGQALKGSIVVANEDGVTAARKSASAPAIRISCRCCCSAAMSSRSGSVATGRSMRRRKRRAFPIGVHAFGFGGNPITASGWPSYYIEEMVGHSQCQQTALRSLVLEGVFERFRN